MALRAKGVKVILSAFIVSQSAAQLLGCDDIGCPMGSRSMDCDLGGTSPIALGVSILNTTLSSQPLTWTIAISQTGVSNSSDLDLFQKDFYLGQPPSIQLQNSQAVAGCGIFFEGVSSTLQYRPQANADDLLYDDGTCEDALTTECVSAWTTQANDELTRMVQNRGPLDCLSMANTLQGNPPVRCASMYGNWGAVTVATISGSESAPPLTLSNCNPTISSDYTVRHVASFNASLIWLNRMHIGFISGVTPVMTILAPGAEQANQAFTIPEVHLNCLKIKSINFTESTTSGESESASVPTVSLSSSTFAMLVALSACVLAL